jgi:hypothetical protein
MPLIERRHLGRQEEDINETGIQVRSDDPVSPVLNQTWINTTQNRLKYFDGTNKIVVIEGTIGAAQEVPVSGILDAVATRSFYKDISSDYSINSFINFTEGLTVFLKIKNTNVDVKEVTGITVPSPTAIGNGSYFLINTANNANKYYVWADFDSFGVDPAIGGRTGVRVLTSAGLQEKTNLTFPAASTIGTGQHFFINSALDAQQYYVWFNKDGNGGDPLLGPARTGIQVAITTSETSAQVAAKVQAALDTAVGLDATVLSNVVSVTTSSIGTCTDASNINVSGLTISITQQGKIADTATQFAVKVAAALDALAGFVVPVPTTPTLTVTNADFGFTDNAVNGNMGVGLVINVTTQGSGQVTVSFPVNAAIDESVTAVIPGSRERIFRLFRSGSFIYVSGNGLFSI